MPPQTAQAPHGSPDASANEGKAAFAHFPPENINNKTGNQAAKAKPRQTGGSRWKWQTILRTGESSAAACFCSQQAVRGPEGVFALCQVNGGLSRSDCQAVIDCYATRRANATAAAAATRRRTGTAAMACAHGWMGVTVNAVGHGSGSPLDSLVWVEC